MGLFDKIKHFFDNDNEQKNFMEEKEHKFQNSMEMIEAVKKDLNINLQENEQKVFLNHIKEVDYFKNKSNFNNYLNNDYLKKRVLDSDIMESLDYDNDIKIKGYYKFRGRVKNGYEYNLSKYGHRGLTCNVDGLSDIVKQFRCNDGAEFPVAKDSYDCIYDTAIHEAYSMYKYCVNNLNNVATKGDNGSCFIMKNLSKEKVDKKINEELDKFLTALDKNHTDNIGEHLRNVKSLKVVYEVCNEEWRKEILYDLCYKAAESVIDNKLNTNHNKLFDIKIKSNDTNFNKEAEKDLTNMIDNIECRIHRLTVNVAHEISDAFIRKDFDTFKDTLNLQKKEHLEEINAIFKDIADKNCKKEEYNRIARNENPLYKSVFQRYNNENKRKNNVKNDKKEQQELER